MTINFNKAEFVLSATTQNAFIRDGRPQVTFAGRSNVGKSSVINRLLNRKNFARVGATPGKTSQVNYFRIDGKLYFTDLPGYGYAKVSKEERERWGRLMESYFQEPGLISLGILIVDARHKPSADDVTMCDWFKGRLPHVGGGQQGGQAEKAGSRAQSGDHPPDAGASPRHAAGPLLRREGRRQDGGAVPAEPVLRLSMFRIPLSFPAGGYTYPFMEHTLGGRLWRTNSLRVRRNFHQILYEKIVFFLNCDTIRWNETAPCGQKAPVRKNSADKSVPSGTERRFLL